MATRYLNSSTGADSGAGTDPGSPWATLAYTHENCTDGDTVHVAYGTNGQYDTAGTYESTARGYMRITSGNVKSITFIGDDAGIQFGRTKPSADLIGAIWIEDSANAAKTLRFENITFKNLGGTDDYSLIRVDGHITLEFEDCTFDTENLSSGLINDFCIYAHNTYSVTVSSNRHFSFVDCTFNNMNSGAFRGYLMETTDFTVTGCTINNGGAFTSFSLETATSATKVAGDILFNANTFVFPENTQANTTLPAYCVWTKEPAGTANFYLYGANSFAFTNNTATVSERAGATDKPPGMLRASYGAMPVTISGNTFTRTQTTTSGSQQGIVIEAGLDDNVNQPTTLGRVSVFNNTITHVGTFGRSHGITCGRGTDTNGAEVYDNTVVNCDVGINLENSSLVEVHHNQVYAERCLLHKGSTNCTVYNNSFESVELGTGNGAVRWDDGDNTINPTGNVFFNNIVSVDAAAPIDYTLLMSDGDFPVRSFGNVYVAGADGLFSLNTTTGDTVAQLITEWATFDNRVQESNSLLLTESPFEDAAGGNFSVKESVRPALVAAGADRAGAISVRDATPNVSLSPHYMSRL